MTAITPPGLGGNDAAGDIPLFFRNYFYTRLGASPVVTYVLSHIQTTQATWSSIRTSTISGPNSSVCWTAFGPKRRITSQQIETTRGLLDKGYTADQGAEAVRDNPE
ncbi:MAG: hypothetical protein OXL36_12180 [Bryobacterales bacterium]|nr:hypothetical protein [Bryobacterales bacterium]MDE0293738.1 hypothetical protein [Bryobacterales bacterium]